MATNEQTEPEVESAEVRMMRRLGLYVARVTDTGPTGSALTVRVWLLLVVVAVVVAVGDFPLNVVGTVAVMALALTFASRLVRSK